MDNKGLRTELCIFTCHSQKYGIGTPKEYVEAAKDCGVGALAITDLYSTEGYREFYKECLANDITPIFGVSLTIEDYETVILAKNDKGISTINKLASQREFISFDDLKNNNEGIMSIGIANNEIYQKEALKRFDYIGIDVSEPYELSDILETSEYQDKVVVLSCSQYINKEDKFASDLLLGFDSRRNKTLKSTNELLIDFPAQYVIDNPNRILGEIHYDDPLPTTSEDIKLNFISEDAFKELIQKKAKEKLGELSPKEQKRLDEELEGILTYGYHNMFYVASELASFYKGKFVMKGGTSNSFLTYVLGISKINPLEWNLHHGVFLGYDYSRAPYFNFDIDFDCELDTYHFLENLLGEGKVLKTYNNITYSQEDVAKLLNDYLSRNEGTRYRSNIRNSKIFKLLDTSKDVEEVDFRYVFASSLEEVYKYSPVTKDEEGIYHTTSDFYESLSFFPHLAVTRSDYASELKAISDQLGKDFFDLPYDDTKVLSLFNNDDALNKKEHLIPNASPLIGIKGLDTDFVNRVIKTSKPKTVEDIVKILGLIHGTNVWVNNAERLFEKGYELSDIIGNRDDIFDILVNRYHAKEKDAFLIMESVRKGRGLKQDQEETLKGLSVDQYLIDSMKKIQYAFPKSHAINFAIVHLSLAYVKIYRPDIFYPVTKKKYERILGEYRYKEITNMELSSLLEIYENQIKGPEKELASILLEEKERGIR